MPSTVQSLAHTARELVMLPFVLFTFLVFELPKRVVAYVLDTVYALAQLPITWFFKPVSTQLCTKVESSWFASLFPLRSSRSREGVSPSLAQVSLAYPLRLMLSRTGSMS